MADADNRIEVLKEIRDELRGVRSELAELRGARLSTSGVRTQVVDRAARWRIGALASTGALAVVALVLALRGGPASVPVASTPSVAMTPAPATVAASAPTAVTASAPKAAPPAPVAPAPQPSQQAQPVVATKPTAKPAPRLLASAPVAPAPRKRVKPEVAPEAVPAMTADDGDTIPFPPPRRVRVHKMSYGPVETEPAKL
jgi:hypothetical protein